MKRWILLCVWMGCATPKGTDSGWSGGDAAGQEGDGGAELVDESGSGDDGDSTGSGGLDGDGATTGNDGETEDDGGLGDGGGAGDGGSAVEDGGASEDEEAVPSEVPVCLDDHLDYSVQITDGSGACTSPCDVEDDLSYHLTIENTTAADCVIHTSTTCLIENVEISTLGVHGRVVETYFPMCGEALTTHTVFAGGMVGESLLGGTLARGEYVAMINVDMDGGLAYGTVTFDVE